MSEEKSFSASSYWFQQSLKAHIDRDIAKRNKAMDETELQQSKKPANNKRPTFEDYCFEQIKLMEPENRLAFLDINQGESDFYEIGKKWLRDYNLATGKKNTTYGPSVSNAKNRYRAWENEQNNSTGN